MTRYSLVRPFQIFCGLLLLSGISNYTFADPLDDVGLEYQKNGVVATIRLTGAVNYLRHFPDSHGKTLEIFYERPKGLTDTQPWTDNEVRKSPASNLIPSFTVTTRDQTTKPRLIIEFSREAEYSVAPGKDNRSLLITIRADKLPVANVALPHLPTIAPEVVAAPGVVLTPEAANMAESNKQARALMVQGRDALAAGKNDAAVEVFNKLLLLPPNDYTQDGQEWVGVARERAGQSDKAKTEYDLYLRLYTEGSGVPRVVQRLANLSGKSGPGIDESTGEKKKEARWISFGGVSSRYYFGSSTIDSTQTFNGVPQTVSLSLQDQSMLITSLDASERYISDEYDGRLVFRDVNTKNFLTNQSSLNRVNAAYGEIKNRKQNYLLRVGRQSSAGGGVMGRFDGLAASYGDAQDLRVNGVVGTLADYSQGTMPTFFSASVDSGAFSFYGINQTIDGIVDRRAVGTEWRYFEGKKTAFAVLDYDVYFKALNTAQLIGSVGFTDYTLNYMVDHRRAPALSMRNALNGATTSSVNDLVQATSTDSVRDLALLRTATSDMGQVGVTVPFKEKWQVGTDFRVSKITGLPQSGTPISPAGTLTLDGFMPATEGRGTEFGVTAQLIGSGLYLQGDIWSASTTYTTSSLANGYSVFLYNHTLAKKGWSLDTSIMFYRQSDQFGGVTTRTSPIVRGSYRIKDQLTFDIDGGIERTNLDGALVNTKIARVFTSAGLRWDF